MSAASGQERRKHLRLPYQGQVFAWVCASQRAERPDSKPQPVFAEDFSWGGFRLSSDKPIPAGECLEVHIPSIQGQKPVAVQGRIVWATKLKDKFLLGLDCERIPARAVDLIMRHKTGGLAGT